MAGGGCVRSAAGFNEIMCAEETFFVYKYGGHLIYVLLFLFVIHLIIIYTASEKKKREIEIDEYTI